MINLLIADDESIIRQGLLSIEWEKHGFKVVAEADNGFEAMEILQSELIDVVLTDIRMSGMDGIALAKFVHENELSTEVILLSGYSEFEYARSAIQYNVVEYMLKPSDPAEILAAVQRASRELNKKREKDMRIRLLEAELGKKQLIKDQNGITLGKLETTSAAQKILRYLARHYMEPISLSQLSDYLHFSTIYLSKVIKKTTDYTFLELVNAMRIYEAALRIREGEQSLTDICESVSISEPRYFSQVFKKHYGMTPSAYRKEPCLPLDTKLACLVQDILEGSL